MTSSKLYHTLLGYYKLAKVPKQLLETSRTQRTYFKNAKVVPRPFDRSYSSNVSCRIILSTATRIYENLAMEDWLFENCNLHENEKILFIWRNHPCVVIGKFQNPWKECNVGFLAMKRINLARRKSGGGTVYHDMGNINFSVISHRCNYNRKENLTFVADAVMKRWPHLKLSFNKRDDLLLDHKYKVSGTAAKLVKNMAYHHFTLLVDVDKTDMRQALSSKLLEIIDTRASESFPAATRNLSSSHVCIEPDEVVEVVCESFVQKYGQIPPQQYGRSPALQGKAPVQRVDAIDAIFPGISARISDLMSWEWTFGKTPKFSLECHVASGCHVSMAIENGMISDVNLVLPSQHTQVPSLSDNLRTVLHCVPFCPISVKAVLLRGGELSDLVISAILSAMEGEIECPRKENSPPHVLTSLK